MLWEARVVDWEILYDDGREDGYKNGLMDAIRAVCPKCRTDHPDWAGGRFDDIPIHDYDGEGYSSDQICEAQAIWALVKSAEAEPGTS